MSNVIDRLDAADKALTNITTDSEALESAIDAARRAINAGRAILLEHGVEATCDE